MERGAGASARGEGDDPSAYRAPGGDRSRERLYEEHVLTVYGYLARRVGPTAAEELTAEVFLEAFDLDALRRPLGSERAWLFGIALERLRRRYPDGGGRRWSSPFRRPLRARPLGGGHGAVGGRLRAAGRNPMAAALDSLPPADCEVLLLHAWAGLSDVDIAAVLDLSTEAVRSCLARAQGRLDQAFGSLSPLHRRPGLS